MTFHIKTPSGFLTIWCLLFYIAASGKISSYLFGGYERFTYICQRNKIAEAVELWIYRSTELRRFFRLMPVMKVIVPNDDTPIRMTYEFEIKKLIEKNEG